MRVTMLMVIMMMIDEMRAGGHQPPSGRGHILFAGWNRHPLLSFIAIVINGKIYLRHASFIIHQKNTSNIIITVSIIIKRENKFNTFELFGTLLFGLIYRIKKSIQATTVWLALKWCSTERWSSHFLPTLQPYFVFARFSFF